MCNRAAGVPGTRVCTGPRCTRAAGTGTRCCWQSCARESAARVGYIQINSYGLVTFMDPNPTCICFHDIHGPRPYKFIRFYDIHGFRIYS